MASKITKFDKNMSAVAFAEAGEFHKAAEFLHDEKQDGQVAELLAVKRKPYGGLIFFGALSLSGYVALMTHQNWVSEEYTIGSWHAAYPVATALLFSFVHGAFASNLLSVLGIEANK